VGEIRRDENDRQLFVGTIQTTITRRKSTEIHVAAQSPGLRAKPKKK
jgi:hypothetical protein